MIIYEMWSVWDDVHWTEENEGTQTGTPLLLITKHNLEHGYLIVGLMQPSKRRTVMTTTKERK
jgi:hypothetical protein